jgi:hypothetical protein
MTDTPPTVTAKIAAQLPTPLPHWKRVLKRAWSIRLNAAAIVLTGLEMAVPYLDGVLPIPRGAFGALAGLVSMAAIYARIVQQNNLKGTQP